MSVPLTATPKDSAAAHTAGEHLGPWPSAAFDKIEILALVETALSWDLDGTDLPAVGDALGMAEQFTRYGRSVADGLRRQYLKPGESSVGATLGEAEQRLRLKPLAPSAAQRSAAHRAQKLARLIQALNRAMGHVSEERVRAARPTQQQATGKGPLG